jgi:periplasmic protein TonB
MADKKQFIYIVDDEPLQLELLKDHLSDKMAGYEILTFDTGEACIASFNTHKPTIVFLDYNLDSKVKGAMDGLKVLEHIKKVSPGTEVVMISGQDRIEVADKALKLGAFNYIKKGDDALIKAESSMFQIFENLQMKGWDNVTLPARTELVFANRNKQYGAYVLRTNYQKTAATALVVTIATFVLAICAPIIIKKISGGIEKLNEKPVEVTVELKEPPPLDKNEPPPPPPPPPPPTIETVKFTPPVVVDKEIAEEEQPPPQEKLSETNVGVVTQEGTEGATELPPEPVVADPDEGKVFTYVEEMPSFPTGGEAGMYEYISKNIKYPPLARENGISGRVFVNFIVDKNGNVKDVKVLRGIGGGCDEEAIRVIKSMPDWKPGKQNGRAVQVSFNVPINFTLR